MQKVYNKKKGKSNLKVGSILINVGSDYPASVSRVGYVTLNFPYYRIEGFGGNYGPCMFEVPVLDQSEGGVVTVKSLRKKIMDDSKFLSQFAVLTHKELFAYELGQLKVDDIRTKLEKLNNFHRKAKVESEVPVVVDTVAEAPVVAEVTVAEIPVTPQPLSFADMEGRVWMERNGVGYGKWTVKNGVVYYTGISGTTNSCFSPKEFVTAVNDPDTLFVEVAE